MHLIVAIIVCALALVVPTGASAEPISTAIGLTALIFNTAGAVGIGFSMGSAMSIGGALVFGAVARGLQVIPHGDHQ